MLTVYRHELKQNLKSFVIWSLTVGLLGLFCILLYSTMGDSMKDLSDSFSNMGAFSEAFGMNTLGIGTLIGYFATEIGTIHGLGGALFAAILATGILAKEEDGHTGEFLYALPVSRGKIVTVKLLCIVTLLIGFTVICAAFYVAGFAALQESVPVADFIKFCGLEFLLDIEIAAVCFLISSFSKKNKLGTGLGVALIFYVYDLIGRVVPDLKDYLFIGPFSYANASEIFAGQKITTEALVIASVVCICTVAGSYVKYLNKDLAS